MPFLLPGPGKESRWTSCHGFPWVAAWRRCLVNVQMKECAI